MKLVQNLLRICIKPSESMYKTFLEYVHFLRLLSEGSLLILCTFPSHLNGGHFTIKLQYNRFPASQRVTRFPSPIPHSLFFDPFLAKKNYSFMLCHKSNEKLI